MKVPTKKIKIVLGVLGIAVILGSGAVYKVDQTEQALILEFGKPVFTESTPGLHFKKPFFLQTVLKFDKRILHLDAKPRNLIASEGRMGGRLGAKPEKPDVKPEDKAADKPLAAAAETAAIPAPEIPESQDNADAMQDNNTSRIIVDAYAKYKITDPLLFYQSVQNESKLNDRLDSILESNLREVVGSYSLHDLLTDQRMKIMEDVRNKANAKMQGFGIDVVDVRIMRADLPPKNFDTVIKRMRAERQKEAAQFRARGAEEAQIISSTADKHRTILLANAERDAQHLRGQGDAEAAGISAKAYGVDPEFYGFARSMEAYRTTIKQENTSMVLSPNSDFFRFFEDMQGRR